MIFIIKVNRLIFKAIFGVCNIFQFTQATFFW